MSGSIEWGVCSICKSEGQVSRKYYYYDIVCDCCRGGHFEIVKHCDKCEPKAPRRISAVVPCK